MPSDEKLVIHVTISKEALAWLRAETGVESRGGAVTAYVNREMAAAKAARSDKSRR